MSVPLHKEESFTDFMKQNKVKIYQAARDNTKYNQEGKPTISKDDEWFKEDEWDEHFKRINKK